jgi:hypothetical protein
MPRTNLSHIANDSRISSAAITFGTLNYTIIEAHRIFGGALAEYA